VVKIGWRSALIVVSVECWCSRRGCRVLNSCRAVRLVGRGGLLSGGGLIFTVGLLVEAAIYTGVD
jgi:hypothetical protein